jgi:hypothetical protein
MMRNDTFRQLLREFISDTNDRAILTYMDLWVCFQEWKRFETTSSEYFQLANQIYDTYLKIGAEKKVDVKISDLDSTLKKLDVIFKAKSHKSGFYRQVRKPVGLWHKAMRREPTFYTEVTTDFILDPSLLEGIEWFITGEITNYFCKHSQEIFYHDINIARYPEYLYRIEDWSDYIKSKMNGYSVLLFNDNNMKIYHDTKQELLQRYLGSENNWNHLHHIWAGALAIRNDDFGKRFLEEWVGICSKVENVSPITDFSKYPGYIWHSQEQACLSVLYYLRKNTNKIKCIFLWGSRRIPTAPLSIIKWPVICMRDSILKFIISMISAR